MRLRAAAGLVLDIQGTGTGRAHIRAATGHADDTDENESEAAT
jgi:hypothetical protein